MDFLHKYVGLHIADASTLIVYLIGITYIGMRMGKTVHNTTDFFVGGRRFGKLFSTFFAFGAGTHSDQAVSVAAKTYTSGMSGIWYQWLWLFVTPFYWVITPIYRRCRAITAGDYFEARFSHSVAMLYVVVGIFNLMINIGTMLIGSGAVIDATTGGTLDRNVAIIGMTVLFVTYGVVGGFAAAVVTDFVQGLLTIVFSFILLPFAIMHLGGFAALHEKVAQVFAEHPAEGMSSASDMWSLHSPGEITIFYIIILSLNALIGVAVQPQSIPGGNCSKTEREAQIGVVVGNLIKRFCTVAWCLIGICAFVMFPGMTEGKEIDQAFGKVAHELLPTILPGLIGIFIASLLASIMSSCDAFMITCSGLFTQNLYRPMTGGKKSEKHYVNVGRVAAAVVVAGGVFFAYQFKSVLDGLELFWKISALMGIPFWAGFFWRRTTSAGAWAGTLLAFAVVLFTSNVHFGKHEVWSFTNTVANRQLTAIDSHWSAELDEKELSAGLREVLAASGIEWGDGVKVRVLEKHKAGEGQETQPAVQPGKKWLLADGAAYCTIVESKEAETLNVYINRLPVFMMWKGELALHWQMICYLSVGVAGVVVVSLLTPRQNKSQLDRFYGVVRTPVKPNEIIDAPFTLPAGVEPVPGNKLFDHPDWEIQVPTKRNVIGFLVVAMIAAALVASVFWLVRIGA